MTGTNVPEATAHETPEAQQSNPDTLNLLGSGGGCCGGSACGVPAP